MTSRRGLNDNDRSWFANHHYWWRRWPDHDHRLGLADYNRRGGVTMRRRPAHLSAVVVVMNATGREQCHGGQTSQRKQSSDLHIFYSAACFGQLCPVLRHSDPAVPCATGNSAREMPAVGLEGFWKSACPQGQLLTAHDMKQGVADGQ